MKYACVNKDQVVDNVIMWNGEDEIYKEDGCQLIHIGDEEVHIGWTWDGTNFNQPVISVSSETLPDLTITDSNTTSLTASDPTLIIEVEPTYRAGQDTVFSQPE